MNYRVAFGVLFILSLAVWTWKLLESNPLPPVVKDFVGWSEWLMFILAKALHAGAYAWCTVLGRLAVSPRWRIGIAIGMVLHGIGTEIGQTFVPHRVGSVRDVLIDAGGVLAGWAFAVRVLKS